MPKIGDHVIYGDEFGTEHHALVTQVWGDGDTPSLNLVAIDPDETKYDTYGRQIIRPTSCVHKTNQAAHGRFWREP